MNSPRARAKPWFTALVWPMLRELRWSSTSRNCVRTWVGVPSDDALSITSISVEGNEWLARMLPRHCWSFGQSFQLTITTDRSGPGI